MGTHSGDGAFFDGFARACLLSSVMESIRAEGKPPLASLSGWLKEHRDGLTLRDAAWLLNHPAFSQGPVPPPWLTRFVSALLQAGQAKSLLDPAGGNGISAALIADEGGLDRVDVLCSDPLASEVYRAVSSNLPTLYIGDFGTLRSHLPEQYDAIVSFPPWGQRRETREYTLDGRPLELRDEPALLLMIGAGALLSPNGVALFGVTPNFARDIAKTSVRQNLPSFGLYLTGLLRLRPGTFGMTSLPMDLAIIQRRETTGLYVAEVPEDDDAQRQLIERLLSREPGPLPSQGCIVNPLEFRDIESLQAVHTATQLARGKGLEAVRFPTAVPELRRPHRKGQEFHRCEEHPNAVYLPEMAETAATISQAELPPRLKSYLQLIVDCTVVLPEYLAQLFNTALGHSIRRSAMSGGTIPRISSSLLQNLNIYLPPLREQQTAIDASRRIRLLRGELSELESKLWDSPRQASAVLSAVASINHEDRFEDWTETLPFPLASILRAYIAVDCSDKDKYERLLHFFEALAAFCATVHLSACRSVPRIWDTVRPRLAETLGGQHMSFNQPTFGLWRNVANVLGAAVRAHLNGKAEDRDFVLGAYCLLESLPLEALCSRNLLSILEKSNGFRNHWTGHGGAPSATEAEDRHAQIREQLVLFREGFGSSFLRYLLIQPQDAKVLPGPLFEFRMRKVMGSNPVLETGTIQLVEAATSNELYLYNPGNDRALHLEALFALRNTPQPACYFLNRVGADSSHFVSYQFAEVSDVEETGRPGFVGELINEFAAPTEEPL